MRRAFFLIPMVVLLGLLCLTIDDVEAQDDPCLQNLGSRSDPSAINRSSTITSSCATENRPADESNPYYSFYYSFSLTADSPATIELTSNFDNYLYLINGGKTGTVAVDNDDGGTDSNARIHVDSLAAGSYTIEVATANPNITGPYSMTLTVGSSVCYVALGSLENGQVGRDDTLETDCESDANAGYYSKYFSFSLSTPADVQMTMTAGASTLSPTLHLRKGLGGQVRFGCGEQRCRGECGHSRTTACGTLHRGGHKRIIGQTGEFSLRVIVSGIASPTQTLIPTPTPRAHVSQDWRMIPNPENQHYVHNQVYTFTLDGVETLFPVDIRAGNTTIVKLTTTEPTEEEGALVADCSAVSVLEAVEVDDTVYIHICNPDAVNSNSILYITQSESRSEITKFQLTIPSGEPVPTPSAVGVSPATIDPQHDEKDVIGMTILVAAICSTIGVGCAVVIIKNTIGVGLAAGLASIPMLYTGGRISGFSVGLSIVIFILALLGASLLMGVPLWYGGSVLLAIFGAAGLGAFTKLRRVNA